MKHQVKCPACGELTLDDPGSKSCDAMRCELCGAVFELLNGAWIPAAPGSTDQPSTEQRS
jgi:rubredoxin